MTPVSRRNPLARLHDGDVRGVSRDGVVIDVRLGVQDRASHVRTGADVGIVQEDRIPNFRVRSPGGRPPAGPLRARRLTPALPLVISPHGRNVRAAVNAEKWGNLPARGPFALAVQWLGLVPVRDR